MQEGPQGILARTRREESLPQRLEHDAQSAKAAFVVVDQEDARRDVFRCRPERLGDARDRERLLGARAWRGACQVCSHVTIRDRSRPGSTGLVT